MPLPPAPTHAYASASFGLFFILQERLPHLNPPGPAPSTLRIFSMQRLCTTCALGGVHNLGTGCGVDVWVWVCGYKGTISPIGSQPLEVISADDTLRFVARLNAPVLTHHQGHRFFARCLHVEFGSTPRSGMGGLFRGNCGFEFVGDLFLFLIICFGCAKTDKMRPDIFRERSKQRHGHQQPRRPICSRFLKIFFFYPPIFSENWEIFNFFFLWETPSPGPNPEKKNEPKFFRGETNTHTTRGGVGAGEAQTDLFLFCRPL